MKKSKTDVSEGGIFPSLSLRLIRHAESQNNQVYRDARYIYRGGTPEFDADGWTVYVDTHRSADPSLSDMGKRQADQLATWLAPHLHHQASPPVQVLTSPMRRTLETIRPTLDALQQASANAAAASSGSSASEVPYKILVHRLYHESEGCHTKDVPEPGMNQAQIRETLCETAKDDHKEARESCISFSHFDADPERGWYCHGTGAETRAESERRAAQFYLWLCEHLDQELSNSVGHADVFDAGVAVEGEEEEWEHDKTAPRKRKRRTCLLVGHADFMSLVLKRIVGGFGHAVENEGIPHRSAFVHFNTGMTELEYFGQGRFLVMATNTTPHLQDDASMRTGGSLKDGWSYVMPQHEVVLHAEVTVAFEDEMQDHVREQTEALRALYLGHAVGTDTSNTVSTDLSIEEDNNDNEPGQEATHRPKHFVVRRGTEVVGVATYSEETGHLTDVAVRPSAGPQVSQALVGAVQAHARTLGRSDSIVMHPRTAASRALFTQMGFTEVDGDASEVAALELKE